MPISGHNGKVQFSTSPTTKWDYEGDFKNFSLTKRKVRYDVTTMGPDPLTPFTTREGRSYFPGLDESTVEMECLIREDFSYAFLLGLQGVPTSVEFYFYAGTDKLAGTLFVTSVSIAVNVNEVLSAKVRANFNNGITATFA